MVKSISIVIPTLNRAELTREAIESCRRQTHLPNEILVVDNGSTDGSSDTNYGPLVRLISEPRQGAGFARSAGISASSSSHILFLDSDDLLEPEALELLSAISSTTNADVSFGALRNFQDVGKNRMFGKEAHYPTASTSLVKRTTFDKFAQFQGDNYSFLTWIEEIRNMSATFESLDQVVCLRRIHESNMGFSDESRDFYLNLVRSRLENRRA